MKVHMKYAYPEHGTRNYCRNYGARMEEVSEK